MALLAPLEKKLYNFLRKTAGNAEEGGDLFQEVLLRAYRYFASYDPRRSFSGWIFAIAHNEIRRRSKLWAEAALPLSVLASDPPAADPNPDAGPVHEAAGRLPVREREAFFLYYYNGFSVAEISDITGRPAGSIKFILFNARRLVRAALEGRHEAR